MPRIFDNFEMPFLPSQEGMLGSAKSADFCVGFFNLRGWIRLAHVDEERFTGGGESKCRLLVGMQTLSDDEVGQAYSLLKVDGIDNAKANQLRKKMAEEFRKQLTLGAPTESDQRNIQWLAKQLRRGKLVAKLFFRNSYYAKMYLSHRSAMVAPIVCHPYSLGFTTYGANDIKQGNGKTYGRRNR